MRNFKKQRQYREFRSDYIREFPDHIRITAHGTPKVIKGFGEHFCAYVIGRTWEDHAARGWAKTLQRAQQARESSPKSKIRTFAQLQAAHARKFGEKRRVSRIDPAVIADRKRLRELNLRVWAFNRELSAKRKAAFAEKEAFLKEWKERHKDVLPSRAANRKAERRRKQILAERTTERHVWPLIKRIQTQPCNCYWCGEFQPDGCEADHVVPLSKGGTNSHHNIVPSCSGCNSKKRDHMPDSPDFPVSNQLQMALVA